MFLLKQLRDQELPRHNLCFHATVLSHMLQGLLAWSFLLNMESMELTVFLGIVTTMVSLVNSYP